MPPLCPLSTPMNSIQSTEESDFLPWLLYTHTNMCSILVFRSKKRCFFIERLCAQKYLYICNSVSGHSLHLHLHLKLHLSDSIFDVKCPKYLNDTDTSSIQAIQHFINVAIMCTCAHTHACTYLIDIDGTKLTRKLENLSYYGLICGIFRMQVLLETIADFPKMHPIRIRIRMVHYAWVSVCVCVCTCTSKCSFCQTTNEC